MHTATDAQERRRQWGVRARIEQLEARSTSESKDGYPDARGAKALVREQFRRAAGQPREGDRELSD
jgi:hypothetical protein